MSRFYALGSGGGVPTLSRLTSCYLLETRRALIFVDCGSGLARLHDPMFRELVGRHRRAIILGSSWEWSHVEGLRALPHFLSEIAEVTIALPGASVSGATPEELLARILEPPFGDGSFAAWCGRFSGTLKIVGLVPGKNRVLGESVHAHGLGLKRLALRLRNLLYVPGRVEAELSHDMLAGATMLVHEAWWDGEDESSEPAGRASVGEALALAQRAGVLDLVLANPNPAYDPARLERLVFAAASRFPRTLLATDMACITVQGASGDDDSDSEAPGAVPSGTAHESASQAPEKRGLESDDEDAEETTGVNPSIQGEAS